MPEQTGVISADAGIIDKTKKEKGTKKETVTFTSNVRLA